MADRRKQSRGEPPKSVDRDAYEVLLKSTAGFTVTCPMCRSTSVGFGSDYGWSEVSGGWGGMFLRCAICQFEAYLWEA